MATTVQQNDYHVAGALSAASFTPPASCITDNAVAANAGVQATKLIHQNPGVPDCLELFGPTTTVTALTKTLGMAHASGTLVAFGAWIEVVASGADRTITVDLQKSTGGGAYATVLSATAGFTNGSTVRSLVSGTLSSTSYVAGDIFRIVVTVAGAAGAQATGLSAKLIVRESPQ